MSDLMRHNDFFENVAKIIEQARRHVGRTADLTMCLTYFEIGRMIVEEEQGGNARAEYGRGLLAALSSFLNTRIKKGFSETNLRNARKFYQVYADSIQQTMSAELSLTDKNHIQRNPFKLGWSHYQILMRIKNDEERNFYELEAVRQQWTEKQLKRQYHSSLYERLALSRDKDEVMRLAKEGQEMEKPGDMMKNPLVLEFLDLSAD